MRKEGEVPPSKVGSLYGFEREATGAWLRQGKRRGGNRPKEADVDTAGPHVLGG